jgi:riboflavin biosynthesis pyrimidine reductase
MERGRPWLRMKAAVSLDGRSALADGSSRWITGEAARADGHAWRKRAGAVLTGVGTVLEDDPRLDVRLVHDAAPAAARDRRFAHRDTAHGARPRTSGHGAGLRRRRRQPAAASPRNRGRRDRLPAGAFGKVDLTAMLADLGSPRHQRAARRGWREAQRSLLRAGLVDELLVYVAPLPSSALAAAWPPCRPLASLDDRLEFAFTASTWSAPICACFSGRAGPRPDASATAAAAPRRDNPPMFTGIVSSVGHVVAARPLGAGPASARRSRSRRRRAGSTASALATASPSRRLHDRGELDLPGAPLRGRDLGREPAPHRRLDWAGQVNLEKALRAGDRLDGHLVSGHVDGIGVGRHFAAVGESWELRLQRPRELARFLAYKGSITVDGVSLTVNDVVDLPSGCRSAST